MSQYLNRRSYRPRKPSPARYLAIACLTAFVIALGALGGRYAASAPSRPTGGAHRSVRLVPIGAEKTLSTRYYAPTMPSPGTPALALPSPPEAAATPPTPADGPSAAAPADPKAPKAGPKKMKRRARPRHKQPPEPDDNAEAGEAGEAGEAALPPTLETRSQSGLEAGDRAP